MSARRQRGLVALLLAAAILTSVATALVIRQANSVRQAGDQISVTNARLEIVRKAMVDFVGLNGRLPCPASGLLADGQPVPLNPSVNCTNTNGTVPWSVLGLSSEQVLDAWGRRLSYRVFTGATGLTITDGADMTNCDSNIAAPVAPAAPNRLCNGAHSTTSDPASLIGFLAYRPGLAVYDDARAPPSVTRVGFVLISHGPTGQGAWLPGGARLALPLATNPVERANTQVLAIGAAPPAACPMTPAAVPLPPTCHNRLVSSDKTIDTTAINHFDDLVVYMTITDLISAAGRGPRDWQ
jgi:hypothetical protein